MLGETFPPTLVRVSDGFWSLKVPMGFWSMNNELVCMGALVQQPMCMYRPTIIP